MRWQFPWVRNSERTDWIPAVQAYLDAHLDRPFRLSDVADVVGVHPVHLSRTFHRRVGRTLSSWLMQRRIERACVLIRNTKHSLTYVALTVGFGQQAHFCRCFRETVGMSAGEYRRRHRAAELLDQGLLCQ
jgi:AraC family transcriptional regulator